MPNILDTVQISGSSYDLKDKNAASVSAVTQQEYDNLPSSAKTSGVLFVITDAQPTDISLYWTSAQTQSAINRAVSGKQDTLSAGTGIDITNNVISATGGGGTTYSAGTNISISNDTISCTLPISAGTGSYSIIQGLSTSATNSYSHAQGIYTLAIYGGHAEGQGAKSSGDYSHAEGYYAESYGTCSHAEGDTAKSYGSRSHAEGFHTKSSGYCSHAEGCYVIAKNKYEHSQGIYNNSVSASTTFGHSGNTLFSVGDGTGDDARHNAFEIKQNGDIYCHNGTSDVKMQDYLQYKIVKVTQAQYDALSPNYDANTVYFIVN